MKNIIKCDSAPAALGPYSHACEANGFIFTSGQLGIDPATGKLAEGDAAAQARQVFENMKVILSELNSSMADVLKTTVFLQDLGSFGDVNAVYAEYFGPDYPARSCVEVSKLPMGALVEVEAIIRM